LRQDAQYELFAQLVQAYGSSPSAWSKKLDADWIALRPMEGRVLHGVWRGRCLDTT
jgi:hypothetical protein